ncbi:MAG: sigma-70 family RNA polymerase sigma factor [Acidobacteria bacterium]|nr:sigma-70 family RNA polymerase sigma factor [Acidobacteriota bacterium]
MSNVAVWPEQTWPLAKMYGQWRAPLLRYLAAMGLTKADSEDVAQEVFLALVHHLQRDGARDNLRGWVFRVGHNLALKRRMQLGRVAESIEVSDPGPSPEELAVLKRRQERLQAVVAALPERDRCCLVLRAEGLRYREIAEVLEMSLGTVASSLARSLGKLAEVEGR